MSTSSINANALLANLQGWLQRARPGTTASAATSAAGGSDGSAISLEGFAALLQNLQGAAAQGGPRVEDDRAAAFGARLQAKDAALFKRLDGNADGVLSAQELKDGRDLLRAAHAARVGQRIYQENPALFKALDQDGDGTLGDQELKAGRALLNSGDPFADQQADGQAKLQANTITDLLQQLPLRFHH